MRLAYFGGGCSALGGACLLLAACAGNAPRMEPMPPPAAAAPATTAQESAAPVVAEPATSTPVESPWPQLRATFAMPGCDYNPSVRHWTRMYSQVPKDFASSLGDAMSYVLLVREQLDKHHLPGEFAFLPYLESNYVPIATSGDRAAGIWQLMPDTAIEAGIRITPDYDGRLDIYASTIAAIGLLQQYHEEFGDWRIADMAFNAGLYKLRQQVASHPSTQQADRWSAHELGRLRVNAGTHDHLAKLLALACIVSDPERYHVRLPEPQLDDALTLLDLPAPVDLHLAARLARLDMTRLLQLNPGFVRGHMPADGPFHLLVPSTRRLAVEQTLGKLPQYTWRNWHEVVLKQSETLDLFAMLIDIDPTALATVNGYAADAALAPGTRLLLPGVAADTNVALAEPAPAPADDRIAEPPESLVVHAGDTLWDIARRYGLRVDDLVRWNGLTSGTTLHLGQRIRLSEPAGGGASVGASMR
jgi:membrane-bound lytic murein transglycosylase D